MLPAWDEKAAGSPSGQALWNRAGLSPLPVATVPVSCPSRASFTGRWHDGLQAAAETLVRCQSHALPGTKTTESGASMSSSHLLFLGVGGTADPGSCSPPAPVRA